MVICKELQISRSSFYYWVKRYSSRTTANGAVVTPKEFDSMKHRLGRCENIICVLKAANCTTNAPLRDRLAEAEKLHGSYSVHVICEALEISRGTFYNHILRNKRDDAWFLKRRESLKASIREIYDESNQIFGASKIKTVLANQGQTVSEKIIAELMREMGLHSMRNGSKKDYMALSREHWKSNLLLRNFDVKEPNKVWASDVTCYKHKENFFYICAFIDLFSRKVLSLSVGRNNSTNLVRKAFDAALAGREIQGLMIHTDRGTPYTSYTARWLVQLYTITLE